MPTSTLQDLAMAPQAPTTTTLTITETTGTIQYVTLAFDGSYSLDMWKQTRAFAQEMAASGTPVHFTYFISGVYLLGQSKRMEYAPPEHATGTSAIGFAIGPKDVADRLEQMNDAIREGHEIGSHANGHFSGATWSQADWKQELDAFDRLTQDAGSINGLQNEPEYRRRLMLPPQGIIGFRAPELGVSPGLWAELKARKYRYDASRVGKPAAWPVRSPEGFWNFPLAKIRYATTTSDILSMDYNFYFKQSQAKDVAVKGSPEWQYMYDTMLMSYRNYFQGNYTGSRAPVTIGHHFSLWNDGVYWEVMKEFAREVCGKPDVRCVTMSELADALDRMSQ